MFSINVVDILSWKIPGHIAEENSNHEREPSLVQDIARMTRTEVDMSLQGELLMVVEKDVAEQMVGRVSLKCYDTLF